MEFSETLKFNNNLKIILEKNVHKISNLEFSSYLYEILFVHENSKFYVSENSRKTSNLTFSSHFHSQLFAKTPVFVQCLLLRRWSIASHFDDGKFDDGKFVDSRSINC